MDSLFVIRERLQELYSKNSRVMDKAVQFVLALVTFYLINKNVGFMKMASTPVVMLALSIICTFFPPIITVIAATILILAHMYAVSLGALIVTALVFLLMYIFYLRLTPKKAIIVLLTPIAFALKIPVVIPIACALVSGPLTIVPVCCGTIVFYMMEYVKKAASGMKGEDAKGFMGQITAYVKQVFQDKELWIILAAFVICFLVVYTIRRQSVNHAWKIAIVAGAVVNIIVVTVGDVALGVHTTYGSLIVGSVVAVLVGMVLEFFFFSVDYARSENLQYEDDEYYYYVKAVPKLSVATPEKTVKRINERQETEIMNTAEVRKRAKKQAQAKNPPEKRPRRNTSLKETMNDVDKTLLEQSLKNDLDLK